MPLFSRLFGKSAAPAPDPEPIEYNGYRIYPAPMKDAGSYRVAARIEKDVDGETKIHQLIRADNYAAPDQALEASVMKAKQAIDQLGDTIFG